MTDIVKETKSCETCNTQIQKKYKRFCSDCKKTRTSLSAKKYNKKYYKKRKTVMKLSAIDLSDDELITKFKEMLSHNNANHITISFIK